jgi:fumarate hydratase subunit beta
LAEYHIAAPLTDEKIAGLECGDTLYISGVIYTARDTAHKRLIESVEKGEALPFDLRGQIIYYVGPAPARPGSVIGSAGPTTSYRMDLYSPKLIELGLKGMIGKGGRSPEVIDSIRKYRAIYCAATGGAGALLSKCIKKSEIIAYEDLGPEAIRKLEVENFPVTVINDIYGNDLYEQGVKKYSRI